MKKIQYFIKNILTNNIFRVIIFLEFRKKGENMDINKELLKTVIVQNRTIIQMLQIIMQQLGASESEINSLMEHFQKEGAKSFEECETELFSELNDLFKR